MSVRVLITLAVLLSSRAGAETRAPWHATAIPPRAGLPTVTIDLGYPGPYIPWKNAPITLRASAGDFAFDGYIGFHFAVGGRRTLDTPVIARAVLQPRERWSFATFARVVRYSPRGEPTPRNILIEWRDRSMRVAAVRDAGLPPWTDPPRPLRVVPASGDLTVTTLLGRDAYAERADALSDRAQWYAGLSSVVTPLDLWLDLPKRVREAIFGSGISVVFFGLPRTNQQPDVLDRTLLPVAFSQRPAAYDAPWPYGSSGRTPLSWTAKNGASTFGGRQSPYIVRSDAAAWAADEAALSRPLPAMTPISTKVEVAYQQSGNPVPGFRVRTAWPTPPQLLRVFPAPAATIAAILGSLGGWLALRKKPRAAAAAALVIVAVVVFAQRDSIRPASGMYDYEIRTRIAPGIMEHLHARHIYGASPLGESTIDPELARTSITGGSYPRERAEVRTSNTAPSMGLMEHYEDWNGISRWSVRRELGEPAVIRIRSRDPNKLVLEYESPVPIGYIHAEWVANENLYFGGTAVRNGKSGIATIRHARDFWSESEPFIFDTPRLAMPGGRRGRTRVVLLEKSRTKSRSLHWFEPALDWNEKRSSFLIGGRLEKQADGSTSCTFALPLEQIPAEAAGIVNIAPGVTPREVEISWATGTATAVPSGHTRAFWSGYVIPPAVFREVLNHEGVLNVRVIAEKEAEAGAGITIEIREKKP